MFETSALNGRVAEGVVRVREAGLQGMITLRGDLADPKLKAVCTGLTGTDFPGRGQVRCVGEKGVCWMSPDELLILVPHGDVADAIGKINKSLKGKHFLAVNVSDARALIEIEGAGCREVIARLSPVDMHPESFQPGMFRRTRMAQIPAAFWMRDEAHMAVICFRSVAEYAFGLLENAARSEPAHFL